MDNMPVKQIYITNQLETKSSFGVITSSLEQVYIPASIGNAANLQVGESYNAVIIPNTHPHSNSTPWMAVRVTERGKGASEGDTPEDDFADVCEALSDFEYPVEAQHSGVDAGRLHQAWRKGRIVRVEAKQSPHHDPRILWAADMELV